MRGGFWLFPSDPKRRFFLPNTVVDEGEEKFMSMLCANEAIGGGGNFYVGLCGDITGETLTLAGILGEPSTANGYGRIVVNRDETGAGWPDSGFTNGNAYRRTGQLEFTATGGNYDTEVRRAFLCNVETGSVGTLFAISSALPASTLVTPTASLQLAYQLFLI